MNRSFGRAAFFSLAVLLGACASGPNVTGNSIASPRLKSDTANMVSLIATATAKCPRVDSISVEVIKVDPALKGNSAGAVTSGNIDERWTASLCGQQMPFLVTFIPDGQGGSYFSVKQEKKP